VTSPADHQGAIRPLASLPPGGRGRISELRLEDSARLTPASPLHPGVDVQVLEATDEWLHVRIESREYSLPRDMAEHVLVHPEEDDGASTASDAYTVLVSRAGRANWLVRVIARGSATVVLSERFTAEAAARGRFEELHADAGRLDAAAFRRRHELP
jgi:FeoA-like protein